MMSHKIYLLKYPAPPRQRSHFAIWAPSTEGNCIGKIIQVLGTPFTGFRLDIQQVYNISKALPKPVMIDLGVAKCNIVIEGHIGQLPGTTTARDKLEFVATSVIPPGPSRNPFVADWEENRRCQEWTAEYVGRLIKEGILAAGAKDIIEAHRDSSFPKSAGTEQ